MRDPRPIIHARDHWASGTDPAATAWYVAGDGTNPDLEAPWTGTFRWRFDGNGDLELDGDITGGTFTDTVIFLPSQFWPAVTRTRPGWLTSDDALIATTVSSVDGEVTVSEVTASGGGGGSGAAADVTFTPSGSVGSSNVQDAIEEVDTEKVPNGRTITAGSALTGGGDLSANRTLDVAVDGSTIEVSSDALRVKAGGITSSHIADGTIATGDLAFDVATQAELDAHTGGTSGAHAASAISADSTTLVGTATDVQGVLEELDNAIAAVGTPNADDIAFTPAGSIGATDVQAAIEEVAAEAGSGSGAFAVIGLG